MKSNQTTFAKRALLVGLLASGGILAVSAFAMAERGPEGQTRCEMRQGQEIHAGWEARRTGHLAELKDKLKLTAGQEAAWNAFAESAPPGMHRMAGDRQAMRGELEKLSTPARLDRMLALSDMRRAQMLERAEAVKAFYAQLTPEQQNVFDAEAMPERHRGRHHPRHQS